MDRSRRYVGAKGRVVPALVACAAGKTRSGEGGGVPSALKEGLVLRFVPEAKAASLSDPLLWYGAAVLHVEIQGFDGNYYSIKNPRFP